MRPSVSMSASRVASTLSWVCKHRKLLTGMFRPLPGHARLPPNHGPSQQPVADATFCAARSTDCKPVRS
jgi:hypothetical protein